MEMDKLFSKYKGKVPTIVLEHNKDYYEVIDWVRGYEVDYDRISSGGNTIEMIVEAFSKLGEYITFRLRVEASEREDIKVEFSKLEIEEALPDIENMSEEEQYEVAKNFIMRLTEKMKKENEENKGQVGTHCDNCGRNDLPLSIVVDMTKGKRTFICSVCQHKSADRSQGEMSLKQYDKLIGEMEAKLAEMELMIASHDMPKVPKGLEKFAFTPVTIYQSFQAQLAYLKSERIKLISELEFRSKLERQLSQSIEEEDFEKSALLRDKLNSLKD